MATIPEMHDVDSSNIAAVGHDEVAGDLHVRFANGNHYSYSGVPRETFDTLKASDSVGRFFHTKIKANESFKPKKIK